MELQSPTCEWQREVELQMVSLYLILFLAAFFPLRTLVIPSVRFCPCLLFVCVFCFVAADFFFSYPVHELVK